MGDIAAVLAYPLDVCAGLVVEAINTEAAEQESNKRRISAFL